jgi:alkyldihydroxyacetonephosphate synthase
VTITASRNTAVDRFLQILQQSVPDLDISHDVVARDSVAADRWPAAAKWTENEQQSHRPVVVVRPTSAHEVSAVLIAASSAQVKVMAFGAGSGVVGGVIGPDATEFVTLDLRGLDGAPTFNDDRGEVVVPAGMIGADLETQLRERGRRIPHYPQSLGLASVGGLVATRSSGTFSSKYGNIENFLVALEVVLPDGRIITTRAVPRASTGPEIAQFFVGSEGTLGIITSVTLRTFPVALDTRFRGAAFADIATGLTAVRQLFDAGLMPAVVRYYDADEAAHLFEKSAIDQKGRALLILGFDGHPDVVAAEEKAALAVVAAAGGDDLGASVGDAWESSRFDASWLDRGNASELLLADAIEVSASWPVLAELHDRVIAHLSPFVDKAYAHFSHFYPNGGAIYFILFTSGENRAAALERYTSAWESTLELVHAAGGSISHHHGVGEARKNWMATEHGTSLSVLQALKKALDPHEILAPGKLGLVAEGVSTEGESK